MKTFDDINFEQHPVWDDGIAGKVFFENGYGVSVIQSSGDSGFFGFGGSYTDGDNEYELAVLVGGEDHFCLTYDTPITDDVIGHCSPEKISDLMKQVQELPRV